MSEEYWHFIPLNAEPWSVGPLSLGRRNGKMYPMIGQNTQLHMYQEAIKEALEDVKALPEGKYALTFYVWRSVDSYQSTRGRKVHRNVVDATNIQKATEDALQGILFNNDRDVRDIRTVIVEQEANTTPGIVLHARPWEALDPSEIPDHVWSQIDTNAIELSFDYSAEPMHNYHTDEEVF
jgi:Holliday junction resolvase RusA-like endonuclease